MPRPRAAKPIPHSITLWAAIATLLAPLISRLGINASASELESILLAAVEIVGPLVIIYRRYAVPARPLQGWLRPKREVQKRLEKTP